MRIITVMGDSDIGKTTTIKNALAKLLSKGAALIFYKILGADNQDFHAVVLWKSRVIALCSLGDTGNKNACFKYVVDGLNLAKRYNADVLVNALSYSIKAGGKDKSEKEYSVILNKTLRTAKYIPIEPCFFKSSVRKIIREIKKAEKNVLLCYKCLCCKCKKNIVKKVLYYMNLAAESSDVFMDIGVDDRIPPNPKSINKYIKHIYRILKNANVGVS